jgi:hypothetical protein
VKQQFIWIGDRILNLANVRYMQVESEFLVNVYFSGDQMIQYEEDEAHALLAALGTGYVSPLGVEATTAS